MKYNNCLVGQSGGPSAVINATLQGVVEAAMASPKIQGVYGALNGIEGVLKGTFLDFQKQDQREIQLLKQTPAAALGSCRYCLGNWEEDPGDYEKIFQTFQEHQIGYFFYIGGNDSMDTVNKLNRYGKAHGFDTKIIGVPKTIDNDLMGTDHTPGFGSAAKYIATSVMELCRDAIVYDKGIINVVEVMGRNAGWLAAASALAQDDPVTGGPRLIMFPEVPFHLEMALKKIEECFKENKYLTLVVSEGLKNPEGEFLQLGIGGQDVFGHYQMGGVAHYIGQKIRQEIYSRVKVIEFNVLQRSAIHFASKTDVEEAYQCGRKAVEVALAGESGKMVTMIRRSDNPYEIEYGTIDVEQVANFEKKVPRAWLTEDQMGLSQQGKDYIRPLIQGEVSLITQGGLPQFAKLKV